MNVSRDTQTGGVFKVSIETAASKMSPVRGAAVAPRAENAIGGSYGVVMLGIDSCSIEHKNTPKASCLSMWLLSRCREGGWGGPFCGHVRALAESALDARRKERAMLTWDILNNLAIMATNSRRHLVVGPAILFRCGRFVCCML